MGRMAHGYGRNGSRQGNTPGYRASPWCSSFTKHLVWGESISLGRTGIAIANAPDLPMRTSANLQRWLAPFLHRGLGDMRMQLAAISISTGPPV